MPIEKSVHNFERARGPRARKSRLAKELRPRPQFNNPAWEALVTCGLMLIKRIIRRSDPYALHDGTSGDNRTSVARIV